MKKAVLVVRVSDPKQERDGLSLDNQEQVLRQYAQEKGLEIVREFRFQETADQKIRSKFQQVIKFIKSRKDVEVLIGYRVDRLTRNFRDHVAMDDLRTDHRKELHFVYDRLVVSAKTVGLEIQQWDTQVYLAKMFINRLKTDAAVTIKYKLSHGEWPGKAPYGYRNTKDPAGKSTVVAVEPSAEIVRRLCSLYSTGAYSMDTLREVISDEFHVKLNKSKIDHILGNPFYMGQMRLEGKLYPHVYERLISELTFYKIQSHIETFKKKSFKFAGLPFAYRGLITCGECGCRLTPEKKLKKGKAYVYYHCTEYKGKHNAPWIPEESLTEVFVDLLSKLRFQKNEYAHFLDALRNSHKAKANTSKHIRKDLEDRHRRYAERIERMYEDKLDGEITPDYFEQQRTKYKALQAETGAHIEQLDSADDQYYTKAEQLLHVCQSAADLFRRGDWQEKQMILNLLLQNCQMKEKTLVWELKKPFDTVFYHASRSMWYPLLDMFLSREIEIGLGTDETTELLRLAGSLSFGGPQV